MVDWVSVDCIVVGKAVNGEDGLEKINELTPDIVVLDINMPIKNGIELLDEVQDGPSLFSTIILSSYDEFEYAKKAIEHEVIDYLLKPVDFDELYLAIEKAKESIKLRKNYEYIRASIENPKEINVLDKDLLLVNESITTKQVIRMIKFVEENYAKKFSFNNLVEEIEMSATYLNKKFKEETGYSFNDFLNRYRIQKAIQILSTGDEKISMVALDVGYSNYQYFIKVFKKFTKMLPSDFQKWSEKHGDGSSHASL